MGIFDFLFGSNNPPKEPPKPTTADLAAKVDALLLPILKDIPEEHWAVLYRKRSRLLTKDEYGSIDGVAWEKELRRYVTKHLIPHCNYDHEHAACMWMHSADHMTAFAKSSEILVVTLANLVEKNLCANMVALEKANSPRHADQRPQNPYEYEHYCAKILRDNGWEVAVTKASGDQGADIRAKKNGVSIVVQCKLFSSPVGNKAVQEVYASQRYYSAAYGVVITNNGFTKSARQLAAASSVMLIHDSEIDKLDDLLPEKNNLSTTKNTSSSPKPRKKAS